MADLTELGGEALAAPAIAKPVPTLAMTTAEGQKVVIKGRVSLHPEAVDNSTPAALVVEKYTSIEHARGGKPFEVSIDNEE